MNNRNRKFINKAYIRFLLMFPDPINGLPATDPHHADVVGRDRIRNDFYVLPLTRENHNLWHSDPVEFERRLDQDMQDLIIYYQGLYIRQMQGVYDVIQDKAMGFQEYKKGLFGL